MSFGIALFARFPMIGTSVMALAAGLKANPLFMILLPILGNHGLWISLLLFFVCGASKSKLNDVFLLPRSLIEAIDLVSFKAKSSEYVKNEFADDIE